MCWPYGYDYLADGVVNVMDVRGMGNTDKKFVSEQCEKPILQIGAS